MKGNTNKTEEKEAVFIRATYKGNVVTKGTSRDIMEISIHGVPAKEFNLLGSRFPDGNYDDADGAEWFEVWQPTVTICFFKERGFE